MIDRRTGRASDQFPLRMPEGMRDRIRAAAEENNRSMNAEVVARLQKSFDTFSVDRHVVATIAKDLVAELRKELGLPRDDDTSAK